MIIERTENEVILRFPTDVGVLGLDNITRYLKYLESVKNSEATDSEANKLANDSKKSWWSENKHKYIK